MEIYHSSTQWKFSGFHGAVYLSSCVRAFYERAYFAGFVRFIFGALQGKNWITIIFFEAVRWNK